MTRQTKTAKQRAEEDLAVAERKVVRLAQTERALREQLEATTRHLATERAIRDHCASHPALQQTPSTTNQEEGTQA